MKNQSKLSKNCSMHGKNRKISGPCIFWTPIKSNIFDVWNWNWWALFGLRIEVGEGSLILSPKNIRINDQISFWKNDQFFSYDFQALQNSCISPLGCSVSNSFIHTFDQHKMFIDLTLLPRKVQNQKSDESLNFSSVPLIIAWTKIFDC